MRTTTSRRRAVAAAVLVVSAAAAPAPASAAAAAASAAAPANADAPARAAAPARAEAPRPLLPNLVALRTTAVLVGPAGSVGRSDAPTGACQPSEVLDDTPSPRRCLRFETRAANAGAGPLELHHRTTEAAAGRSVVQRVYASDGTYRDTPVGTYVFHATHAHFHYSDFAVASLWRSDARGRKLGRAPVRQGRKAGFCLQDVYAFRDAGPPRYTAPGACYPMPDSAGAVAQVSGISAGWADVYDVEVPHQYVEVTGVPDGYYLLQITIDPGRRLREEKTSDNSSWQLIRLCGDKVELVGRTAACR